MPIFSFLDDNLSKYQGLLIKLAICIDIIRIWFRIVKCPLILSRSGLGLLSVPPSFSFQTFSQRLIHSQIIAMAGFYACGAFIVQLFRKILLWN